MRLYKIIAPITCCTLLVSAASAQDSDGWREPIGAKVQTVTVKKQDFMKNELAPGKVCYATFEQYFEIGGRVSECNVKLGDKVSKYKVLVALDQSEAEKNVEECQQRIDDLGRKHAYELEIFDTETESLQSKLEKYKQMISANTAGNYEKMQYELAELRLELREKDRKAITARQKIEKDNLENEYNGLNADISKNVIYSLTDGEVAICTVKQGSKVDQWKSVLAVRNLDNSLILCPSLNITEEKLENYDRFIAYVDGKQLELTVNLKPGDGFTENGTYFNIPDDVDISSAYNVVIEAVSDTQEDVLTIPECTVYKNIDQRYVYRMNDGRKEMVEVLLGESNGSEVVVIGGDLKEGDEIYVP